MSRQVVHRFLCGFGGGADHDNDPFGVGRAVIVEQMVRAAGDLAHLPHIVLHRVGNPGDLFVAGFPALEEDVRVHGGAAGGGMFGVQGVPAEFPEGVHVHQGAQVLIIQRFNFLDLMGSPEPVEEVQHRHPAVYGGQMGDGAQVHDLLRGGRSQQGKARAAHTHHVGMIAEDRQRMG